MGKGSANAIRTCLGISERGLRGGGGRGKREEPPLPLVPERALDGARYRERALCTPRPRVAEEVRRRSPRMMVGTHDAMCSHHALSRRLARRRAPPQGCSPRHDTRGLCVTPHRWLQPGRCRRSARCSNLPRASAPRPRSGIAERRQPSSATSANRNRTPHDPSGRPAGRLVGPSALFPLSCSRNSASGGAVGATSR